MKGNRTLKKYLAMAMAIVFVVSGIVFAPNSARAAAPSGWETINNDGSWHFIGEDSSDWYYYAGGSSGYYEINPDDSDALDWYVGTACSDWGLQLRTPLDTTTVTAGHDYNYTITFTADKAGSLYLKEDISGSNYARHSFSANEDVTITESFRSGAGARIIFNFVGVESDTTFTGIKVTYSELVTTSAETTTRGEVEGNIIEGMTWHGWFEADGWANYDIGTSGEAENGYTLTNKNIFTNWYSIQTGIDGVMFTANKEYTCKFTLTCSEPKSFVVDNRSNDGTVFTETEASKAAGWQNNGDNTYSYNYEGRCQYNAETTLNWRVSLGYNAARTTNAAGATGYQTDTELGNFEANNSLTIEMSDVLIQPTSEIEPGDGYNDCTGDTPQFVNDGWGYNRASTDYNIGYRIGNYSGVDYEMELKNRDSSARTLYIYTDSGYETTNDTTYRYSVTIQNNSATSFTASLLGYYGWKSVLPATTPETVAASTHTTLTGTFTPSGGEYDTAHGRFQIQLLNVPAGAEVGVTAFSVTEVTPWEMIDTYGSFKSKGDWEYYVDSTGEAYYDVNYNPNTYDNVGFKYVKKSSGTSTRYRMRTSVLSDSEGRFNVGDYYDYAFDVKVDSNSADALSSAHLKVVEYTGDSATSYVELQNIGAVNKGNTLSINGTCGATVNNSRIGIVVDIEDDISLHIADFEVTRRGSASNILKSSKVSIEGFQIRSNNPLDTVSYRTMCKAPNIGSDITVDGETYQVAAFGTSYALDTNDTGDNNDNVLNDSYTILDTENEVHGEQYKYRGVKPYNGQNRTYGYEASDQAVIDGWKEGDTSHTYYAFTMKGMDNIVCNTLWVRPFVKATKTVDGDTVTVFIYGTTTAYISVAEIADYLYANSLSKNISAHNYLFSILNDSSLVPTTNPHHRYSTGTEAEHGPVTFGWSNSLYIGFRLVPDTYDPVTHSIDNMQYINIEDWRVHANSSYGPDMGVPGASASYKGVTNEEMAVRIEQPGFGHSDEWENFINWGVQIRLPNRKAYERLVDGKRYQMTITYKTTKAGTMRVKYEGNVDLMQQYEDAEYDGHKEAYVHKVTNQQVGYNTITETFTYHDGYSHAQNDASIVFAPCGSLGSADGFPAGTILSDFDISFDEIPANEGD